MEAYAEARNPPVKVWAVSGEGCVAAGIHLVRSLA